MSRTRPAPGLAAPEPSRDALLRAHEITVARGARLVVRGVDLDVSAGELVALVGPNGAGKSTVLAALAGDLTPLDGSVELDGRPLPAWSPLELARRRAVLPQRPTVTFPFTVAEVVAMGRAPWHRTPAAEDDHAAVHAAMAAVEVTHLARRSVLGLSGGESGRVALARVLAQDTDVLLLDEPTAALDIHHQELTMRVVRDRVDAGAAAVVVLHDLSVAAAHADRIVVLDNGATAATGPPGDVLDGELLSAVYHHPIDVLPHPRTGEPLVLVRR